MRTLYTIIRVGDAPLEHGEVDWPHFPALTTMRALIWPLIGDAGPMEHVNVLHGGDRRDMFVSEYGHMEEDSRGPLPVNDRATVIYRNNWMTLHPGTDPDTLPAIAGTAVLFHRRVWF